MPNTVDCPYCREPIKPGARKCRHCGEMLDGTSSRPAPRQRSLLSSCFLGCGGLIFLVVALVVVVFLVIGWQQRSALNKATALYDQGKHDEAIPLYKQGYPVAGDQKAAVLTRIVEHELSKGHLDEAKKWVRRGLEDRVDVQYPSPDSQALLSQVKDEIEAEKQGKAALAKAQAEARERERQRQQEQNKDRGAGPKTGVTRENYERVQVGMTREEVEAILGRGKEAASGEGVQEVIWQGGFLGGRVISITFQDGRVAVKAIGD